MNLYRPKTNIWHPMPPNGLLVDGQYVVRLQHPHTKEVSHELIEIGPYPNSRIISFAYATHFIRLREIHNKQIGGTKQ